MRRHERMVFSLARQVVRDPATAEEVAQEVFLQFYRSLGQIESDAHALFWLRRVTGHRAIDAAEALAKRATETVDITLDPSLLRLAANFMTDHDADEAAVKELLQGLQGIYVRSYEFDEVGAYSRADIDAVRAQLGKGAWTRLVGSGNWDLGYLGSRSRRSLKPGVRRRLVSA